MRKHLLRVQTPSLTSTVPVFQEKKGNSSITCMLKSSTGKFQFLKCTPHHWRRRVLPPSCRWRQWFRTYRWMEHLFCPRHANNKQAAGISEKLIQHLPGNMSLIHMSLHPTGGCVSLTLVIVMQVCCSPGISALWGLRRLQVQAQAWAV